MLESKSLRQLDAVLGMDASPCLTLIMGGLGGGGGGAGECSQGALLKRPPNI